jgi:hypothetical protein
MGEILDTSAFPSQKADGGFKGGWGDRYQYESNMSIYRAVMAVQNQP